jgi:nucleoid DNA-binding protein
MTLDRHKTIAAIGQRTRLRNHDVQRMLEALVAVWTDELVKGGRIEMENFLVLEVKHVDRGQRAGHLRMGGNLRRAPRAIRRLTVRPSRRLRRRMNRGP